MDILLFGITREMIGATSISVQEGDKIKTVGQLKAYLAGKYPGLAKLSSLAVAVDNEYADDGQPLTQGQEIALIPPVSGG